MPIIHKRDTQRIEHEIRVTKVDTCCENFSLRFKAAGLTGGMSLPPVKYCPWCGDSVKVIVTETPSPGYMKKPGAK